MGMLCHHRHASCTRPRSCGGAAASNCTSFLTVATAVPITNAIFLLCVGAAVVDHALAHCAMLNAHTPCYCFGGATSNRTWFRSLSATAGPPAAVLPAMPTYFHCIASAARSYTFTISAVLVAQSSGSCLGSAVFDRTRLPTVVPAESSGVNFIGAIIQ